METLSKNPQNGRENRPDFPPKPLIFGVLNITSDSFSDGGKYIDSDLAIEKALSLVQEGADVIDIGAQSSNVKAGWVDPHTEWERMEKVVLELKARKIPISVDTFTPEVMHRAISFGVEYINNIRGFSDEESLKVLRESRLLSTRFILMYSHDRGQRAAPESHLLPESVLSEIFSFFREKKSQLADLNVPEDRIIFDPGMGFFLSPDPKVSFAVLASVEKLIQEFPQLMLSVTRKSFLGNALGGIPVEDREVPTTVCELYLWLKKVPIIRTHSPLNLIRAINIWKLSNGEF
ncbi:dihydropteroate synthase [Leptospira broomii serovar Hurstbridge str. 5399]|uniref:Dihydropteroate synthase n=1 Tax=Leptospira broomii serovar Hurstbridge str. 5399 TaxID=1049789 RepID=T0GF47_9LEPT|nr:dihydropteroate synthase [Leptospira broomii]EQA44028.1 dihydropteroate synthase [Leptospira broomii serovar Hurstbridge str. 5399]